MEPPPAEADISLPDPLRTLYVNSPIARGLGASLPILGPVFDALYSAPVLADQQARLDTLLSRLHTRLLAVENGKVDSTWVQSEEARDLIRSAVDKSLKMRDRSRIDAIARIIAGAVTREILEVGDAEAFVDIIGELRDSEASGLSAIYSLSDGMTSFRATNIAPLLPEIWKSHTDFLLNRLEAKGLIARTGIGLGGTDGNDFRLTPTGRALRNFLADNIAERIS